MAQAARRHPRVETTSKSTALAPAEMTRRTRRRRAAFRRSRWTPSPRNGRHGSRRSGKAESTCRVHARLRARPSLRACRRARAAAAVQCPTSRPKGGGRIARLEMRTARLLRPRSLRRRRALEASTASTTQPMSSMSARARGSEAPPPCQHLAWPHLGCQPMRPVARPPGAWAWALALVAAWAVEAAQLDHRRVSALVVRAYNQHPTWTTARLATSAAARRTSIGACSTSRARVAASRLPRRPPQKPS
mmetsp:Transcript_11564/g.26706  ORF Transcript_11564/g.26706 Transcript_11564/m.26706 type:complete len:248 (+) Transcript_11564:245-988(+)